MCIRDRGCDLWGEMNASGVLDKTALVFGQMNEPPGARMRVAETGLTMAEYFLSLIHISAGHCHGAAGQPQTANFR